MTLAEIFKNRPRRQDVEIQDEPQADNHDGPLDLTRNNRVAVLMAEYEKLKAEADAIAAKAKPITKRIDAIKAELKEKLGDAESAAFKNYKIYWNTVQTPAKEAGQYRTFNIKPVG